MRGGEEEEEEEEEKTEEERKRRKEEGKKKAKMYRGTQLKKKNQRDLLDFKMFTPLLSAKKRKETKRKAAFRGWIGLWAGPKRGCLGILRLVCWSLRRDGGSEGLYSTVGDSRLES